MATVQTNIAIQLVQTLSKEELVDFAVAFDKLREAITVPKKPKYSFPVPTQEYCMNVIRERQNTRSQGKLA